MYPSREIVERIKEEYPVGTRVELVKMDDQYAPPIGTLGTVIDVDDIGSLIMKWDNGSGLNVAYGEDVVRKIRTFSLTFQNDKVKTYDHYEDIKQDVEAMLKNDDVVWVDIHDSSIPYDKIQIRKGFSE